MKKLIAWLGLFSSFGTLICCALPALLVSLGLGATLVGLVGVFPQLIWLSERKVWVFGIAGFFLLLGGLLQFHARNLACPTDPQLAKACKKTRGWSWWIYFFSVFIFGVGFFFAFLAPLLFSQDS